MEHMDIKERLFSKLKHIKLLKHFQQKGPHLFTNFRLVPSRKNFQVPFQRASFDNFVVNAFSKFISKHNVVLKRFILYPSLLWYIRRIALLKSRKT